jgi:multiple sugar transport system substrate-binding protein
MTTMKTPGRVALMAAASVLALSTAVGADTIRFWTTEEQPERLERQEAMAADFTAETGIEVEVIPVTESDLGTRATAAFAAGDLPDVIYHTLQYALPWYEAGILDADAATEVIESLGADTFASGALEMAAVDEGYASVPVDGWTQMIVYRADLFEEAGLEPPNSYANVLAAVEALHNPPEMFGFVAATKVDENFMSQVLEHVFLANGVSPVGPDGFQPLEVGPTTEVLEFYRAIVEASPEGELFWQQSRELYFAGRAAMIIWSPFILDELAGLRDSAPPTINDDPTSRPGGADGHRDELRRSLEPRWRGLGRYPLFRDHGGCGYRGAQAFIEYSMSDGYTATLAIAPEGKFPVRRGDGENPTAFTEAWSQLDVGVDRRAPLGDLYAAEMIDEIVGGLDVAQRWGVADGQLALASQMINSQIVNRLVREYMDGVRGAEETVELLNEELGAIE